MRYSACLLKAPEDTPLNDLPSVTTNDIIIGMGEVLARGTGKELHWVMPGKVKTYNREEAIKCAVKLDRLIRRNRLRVKQTQSSKLL